MREILFRGKTDDGEWKYGALLNTTYFDFSTYIIGQEMSDGKYSSKDDHYEVDPKSVGQFTGLTDKNGTKIFEGDIIKSFDEYGNIDIDKVIYNTSHCKFMLVSDNENRLPIGIGEYSSFVLEVVGNIHEVQHE